MVGETPSLAKNRHFTNMISVAGVKIGNIFGDKYEKKAEFAGGLILIILGIKILLEHLNILSF